jgi:hypothetical protein
MTRHVILLRVGIDSGAGGIQSPLFEDGTFEYLPIPDGWGLDDRTYANQTGRHGRPFVEYFPERLRTKMADQPVHFDPEFETFTYGDPGTNKRGLLKLSEGDLLVFYAGLQRWEPEVGFVPGTEHLAIIGYFDVAEATLAADRSGAELDERFGQNAHVRNWDVLNDQRDRLVLVRGGAGSRLLERPLPISEIGADRNGTPLKVLSKEMQQVFGDFGGHIAIQRSMPRTVHSDYVSRSAEFVRSLEAESTRPVPSMHVADVVSIHRERERPCVTAATKPTPMDRVADEVQQLPGYSHDGDAIVPPCGRGPALVRSSDGWTIGPHGLSCPDCIQIMNGSAPEPDDEELEAQYDTELSALHQQFTVLRMMLRAADAHLLEQLVAGAHHRLSHGQF